MIYFADLSAEVLTLRHDIDKLMAVEGYLVEEVSAKAATLNQLLKTNPEDAYDGAEYSLFLSAQLQWLSVAIDKLNEEKSVIANGILRSQRRKKAEKLYGDNK